MLALLEQKRLGRIERGSGAQADALRASRTQTNAKRLDSSDWKGPPDKLKFQNVLAARLLKGEVVLCMPGDIIPSDGEVVDGVASVLRTRLT